MANPIEIRVSKPNDDRNLPMRDLGVDVHEVRAGDKFAEERRSRFGGDLAGWNPHQTSHKAPVRVMQKQGVVEVVAGDNGYTRIMPKGGAAASPGLRPGHVFVGGVETTVEAARNAGYAVEEGEQRRPFGARSATSPQLSGLGKDAFPTIQPGAQRGVEQRTEQKPHSGPQESPDGPDEGAEGATPQEVADAASEAIQGIERAHGSEVVDAGLDDATDSGYLPEADQLPPGVTMEAVEKIVAGYTAVANSALSGVGSSVDMLMETLSDADLREARRASVTGDSAMLRHLGERAVDTLAALPTADPEAFAEMVEGMSPAERKALSRAGNGDWIVTLPGRPPVSFASAVKAGIVRV